MTVTHVLTDEEISRILNESDAECSNSDSEDDLFAEMNQQPTMSDFECDANDEIQSLNIEDVANSGVKKSTTGLRRRATCMPEMGPSLKNKQEFDSSGPKGILESFVDYFPAEFWELLVYQTNLKSVQTSSLSLKTTKSEILHYIGIGIVMGTVKIPQVKMYWSSLLCFPLVTEAMPRDTCYKLKSNLHFVDNLSARDPNYKLWKIYSLVDAVRKQCLTLPRNSHLSINEQMIPFSGRCGFTQYVPSKPNPLGLKKFILASNDRLLQDFCIYVGKGTVPEDDLKTLSLKMALM
ncbi:uncharacterized protein LOC124593790 [Schistocerca americana]|uniref:uncharacterized protein LOC124593790 n=1 Tax=Schistocerca americana TaxID=7009 RepID=UPI001F4FCA6F|nr:uncharacterized protein LOC124593790 [Schistocerca americana]